MSGQLLPNITDCMFLLVTQQFEEREHERLIVRNFH